MLELLQTHEFLQLDTTIPDGVQTQSNALTDAVKFGVRDLAKFLWECTSIQSRTTLNDKILFVPVTFWVVSLMKILF